MSTSFYAADNITDRKTEVFIVKETPKSEIDTVYETERCAMWIEQGRYKRVALQFPDEFLVDSVAVVGNLEGKCDAALFILGDTSYGSCCVDEIAAEHNLADCVVHYGPACLSPICRLPVLYVFGQKPFDVDHCVETFKELIPSQKQKVVLMYNTVYAYKIDVLFETLIKLYPCLLLSKLELPSSAPLETTPSELNKHLNTRDTPACKIPKCGRTVQLPPDENIDSYIVFYIGKESPTLTNLMMNFNKCPFYTYDPNTSTGRREILNINKALMKRYYMVEKAKDADIVGIVVGTLGVANYLQLISRLKLLIKTAGKKSYMFVVGKLNVAKLANFPEIDVFVLVACAENTLIDSSEFYKPVVTPFEMEIACNKARQWTGDYITDFQDILPGSADFVELKSAGSDEETEGDVSLISNKIRYLGKHTDIPTISTDVLPRNDSTTVSTVKAQTAGEFLDSRSWKGLEQKLGETPVKLASEGSFGIAASYDYENLKEAACKTEDS
ncbi:2-(3-amino-3-carboxypropyl)histidine synthase subunit 2-like [Gigantopelta aegis]|uniref:2-(3-amino-3-carboxypropyl)histidine synthase subunit 2-like n=1 Tax=Gigantopelta aegis TaxID=1735272 RepID=UPI001B88D228|nr:2-(3-amino-3-carboxypropyl)histidine synthase subunit 2-like [Gigantopelta aegis]